MVSPDELIKQAAERSGLDDFGDDHFLGPLKAWCKDLEGPHLSERGRGFLTRLVVNDLARRASIIDCLKQNPEIEETPIPPILYITGHERSGTTLLHNLLSLHEGARYLSRWELMMPVPPPEPDTIANDPRRGLVQKSVDALKGSDLESMHWVEAHDPEECPWGFMDCTGLLGQSPVAVMPNWFDWLSTNDPAPTFQSYRKIIQILTWKNRVQDGGFLVLKAPQMSRFLPAFGAAFPEARFVFLHRDPFRVVTSTCTLIDIVNKSFVSDPDFIARAEEADGLVVNMARDKFAGMQAFEKESPGRVVNVLYPDLVTRAADEVARVFAQPGFSKDAQLQTKVEAFLARQKKGRRAKPRKNIQTFGYEQDALLAEPEIAAYTAHYGLEAETTRQTG